MLEKRRTSEENQIMKRIIVLFAIASLAGLLMFGCQSQADRAQKMFDDGKYQEVIDTYATTEGMDKLVMEAKEALAKQLIADGNYEEVMKMYPETEAAKEAKEKMAEKLLMDKQYEQVIAEYPDTKAAMQAKLELAQARGDSLQDVAGKKGKELQEAKQTIERAAERELERIQKIKNPRLRDKAMKEFIANPKFAGTEAVKKAKSM
jgi:hypothetical protein